MVHQARKGSLPFLRFLAAVVKMRHLQFAIPFFVARTKSVFVFKTSLVANFLCWRQKQVSLFVFLVFIHSCKKRCPFQCWKWKPYYWNYNFAGHTERSDRLLLPELLLIYFFPNESFYTFNTVFYINNKAVVLKQNKNTK